MALLPRPRYVVSSSVTLSLLIYRMQTAEVVLWDNRGDETQYQRWGCLAHSRHSTNGSILWFCLTPFDPYTLCSNSVQCSGLVVSSFPKAQHDDVHSDSPAIFQGPVLPLCKRQMRSVTQAGVGQRWCKQDTSGDLWTVMTPCLRQILQAEFTGFLLNGKNTVQVTSQLKLSHLQENGFMAHTRQRNKDGKCKASLRPHSKCLAYSLEVQAPASVHGLLFLPVVTLYWLHNYEKRIRTRQHTSSEWEGWTLSRPSVDVHQCLRLKKFKRPKSGQNVFLFPLL